ncbi:hypothetical protein H8356DRAFT_1362348 [Neocallimastix lanati (nom. inval.)]|nr:hypothetical protein H8356DRAFT_1362348 [Neocallimastix sp. JGI-2020a]
MNVFLSCHPREQEVLLTPFCLFKITKIDRKNKICYLDCLGYDKKHNKKQFISSNTNTTDIYNSVNTVNTDFCDCDDLYYDYPTDYKEEQEIEINEEEKDQEEDNDDVKI